MKDFKPKKKPKKNHSYDHLGQVIKSSWEAQAKKEIRQLKKDCFYVYAKECWLI